MKVMPKALATLTGQAHQKILDHLKGKAETTAHAPLPESRVPSVCSADIQERLYDSSGCAVMSRRGHDLSNEQNKEGEGDSAGGVAPR